MCICAPTVAGEGLRFEYRAVSTRLNCTRQNDFRKTTKVKTRGENNVFFRTPLFRRAVRGLQDLMRITVLPRREIIFCFARTGCVCFHFDRGAHLPYGTAAYANDITRRPAPGRIYPRLTDNQKFLRRTARGDVRYSYFTTIYNIIYTYVNLMKK